MSFKNYLKSQNGGSVVYNFGRMNPPHKEHLTLIEDMLAYAKKYKYDDVFVYTSKVQNAKKNPLNYNDKIFYLKEMVPGGVTVPDNTYKNAWEILENLIKNGYTKIMFMVGEDRINDFQSMYKYAKQWGEEKGVYVEFKIERRKGSRGISGTDMRNFTKEGDFSSFKEGLPKPLKKHAKDIFEKVQRGLS